MQVTFLGTGTSQGVPFIGCNCDVCTSNDKRDNRLRSSICITKGNTSIIVDSGPDFRYQMLRAKVKHINAIVFTHGHKDHVAGLDDVRAYNYWQGDAIDLYANKETEEVIRREFNYVFKDDKYPGIPLLRMNTINEEKFTVGDLVIQPIKVQHYKMLVYGFRLGDFTYITDANFIADEEIQKIKGSKVLVLNALRHESHISHFTLNEAIAMAQRIGAENTYFTHISHQLGLHDAVEKIIPHNMHLAYDGLVLDI